MEEKEQLLKTIVLIKIEINQASIIKNNYQLKLTNKPRYQLPKMILHI